MPGQVAPTITNASIYLYKQHTQSVTNSQTSLKPANRTKSLSTNDSSMINQATQLSQQNVCVQEPVTIDPSLHKKLDKTTSLPIYAHQATLPVGTTITALPGYVYAPAPTTVQLTQITGSTKPCHNKEIQKPKGCISLSYTRIYVNLANTFTSQYSTTQSLLWNRDSTLKEASHNVNKRRRWNVPETMHDNDTYWLSAF